MVTRLNNNGYQITRGKVIWNHIYLNWNISHSPFNVAPMVTWHYNIQELNWLAGAEELVNLSGFMCLYTRSHFFLGLTLLFACSIKFLFLVKILLHSTMPSGSKRQVCADLVQHLFHYTRIKIKWILILFLLMEDISLTSQWLMIK